jgi:acyl-CoA thioesterase II
MTDIESAWPRYPEYSIDLVPCRATARVRVGDVVLAESRSAVRLIETDHVERLYIPSSDVRLELLEANDHQSVCPFKGRASYWSFPGEPAVEDLFWAYEQPFPEVAGIEGYIGVYHEKATVEVEGTWPDGASAVWAFPFWGDQDDLLAGLDAQTSGDGRFTAPGYHERTRNVVEGGQLIGQAIVAAARTVPEQRVTWAAATFVRVANYDHPIDLEVEVVRRGRTFSTVSVRTSQADHVVAPALVMLDSGATDLMRSVSAMPDVAGPDGSVPYDMRVVGRDIRVVDGAYGADPSTAGPAEIHAWIRFRESPDEPALRHALLAQATTHWTIAAAMRPHPGLGEGKAHTTLSTAPMALSVAFHDDAPMDQWLLYTTNAIWSGGGLTQGHGRVFAEDGALVASYSLQAMVREWLSSGDGTPADRVL